MVGREVGIKRRGDGICVIGCWEKMNGKEKKKKVIQTIKGGGE